MLQRPNFCPNCAGPLPDGSHGAQPYEIDEDHMIGWDCYCDACGWGGNIEPDEAVEEMP